jgi:hypothetical protein
MKCIRCQEKKVDRHPIIQGMCYCCGLSARAEINGRVFVPLICHSTGKHEMRAFELSPEEIPVEGLYSWVNRWGVTDYADHEPFASWADVPRFTDIAELHEFVQREWPMFAP